MTPTASRLLVLPIFAVLTVAVGVKAVSFGSPYIALVTVVVGVLFVGGVLSIIQWPHPPDSKQGHFQAPAGA